MSKWIIAILFFISLFSSYVAYQYREDAINFEAKAVKSEKDIEHLQQQAIKNNEVIAQNETTKRELENESIKQQEQINTELADNTCANTLVPVRVAERLYNRADKIRQSTSASELIK